MQHFTCGGRLQTFSGIYNSPIGLIEVKASELGVKSIYFVEGEFPENRNALVQQAIDELDAYFHGKLEQFTVPLDAKGTPFQRRVWAELAKLRFGETSSYLAIAKKLGDAKAVRAVSTANGRNPISIIVPCHRVIGTDGKLTGYAGGLKRKEWLLKHESQQAELF